MVRKKINISFVIQIQIQQVRLGFEEYCYQMNKKMVSGWGREWIVSSLNNCESKFTPKTVSRNTQPSNCELKTLVSGKQNAICMQGCFEIIVTRGNLLSTAELRSN